jgi:ribosomal protein L31
MVYVRFFAQNNLLNILVKFVGFTAEQYVYLEDESTFETSSAVIYNCLTAWGKMCMKSAIKINSYIFCYVHSTCHAFFWGVRRAQVKHPEYQKTLISTEHISEKHAFCPSKFQKN